MSDNEDGWGSVLPPVELTEFLSNIKWWWHIGPCVCPVRCWNCWRPTHPYTPFTEDPRAQRPACAQTWETHTPKYGRPTPPNMGDPYTQIHPLWKTRTPKYGRYTHPNMGDPHTQIWKTRTPNYGRHTLAHPNMEDTRTQVGDSRTQTSPPSDSNTWGRLCSR